MKITIGQLNPVVGDVEGNSERIRKLLAQEAGNSDLIVLPELFLSGYPPLDLLTKEWFRQRLTRALRELVDFSTYYPQTGILVGIPRSGEGDDRRVLYNSAVLIYRGGVHFTQDKAALPAYDLFDETAYFQPAAQFSTVQFKDSTLAIMIGEDLWSGAPPAASERVPSPGYSLSQLTGQADLIINIAAFPFYMGGVEKLYSLAAERARLLQTPLLLVNQVGANDELVFHGQSMLFNAQGEPLLLAPSFQEYTITVDPATLTPQADYRLQPAINAVHDALVLGIKDYCRKTGFCRAVLGLSGGIDSAVGCCLAAEALGSENVLALALPSPYSPSASVEDAAQLAKRLGVRFEVVPISPLYQETLNLLYHHWSEVPEAIGLTEENLQARIRTNILMAYSNKFGYLVLTAGNLSELLVGYCTLYGADMSGGLSVLNDLTKSLVYELAAEINQDRELIPAKIINKAPSAELRPDQLDQDTLPPYPLLDQILHLYTVENLSPDEIMARGFAAEMVNWVIQAVHRSEYKRRLALPGIRVISNPLHRRARLPVAGRY
ncbi:MAG: NAD+ synthase [Firmicutes bacterium]|nr:NAD+ synthase [Bacillota bacterium]